MSMTKRSSELDDVLPRGKRVKLESVEVPLDQKAVPRED